MKAIQIRKFEFTPLDVPAIQPVPTVTVKIHKGGSFYSGTIEVNGKLEGWIKYSSGRLAFDRYFDTAEYNRLRSIARRAIDEVESAAFSTSL